MYLGVLNSCILCKTILPACLTLLKDIKKIQ